MSRSNQLDCLTWRSLEPVANHLRSAVVLDINLNHPAGRQIAAVLASGAVGPGDINEVAEAEGFLFQKLKQDVLITLLGAGHVHAAGMVDGADGVDQGLFLVADGRRALVIASAMAAGAELVATILGVVTAEAATRRRLRSLVSSNPISYRPLVGNGAP